MDVTTRSRGSPNAHMHRQKSQTTSGMSIPMRKATSSKVSTVLRRDRQNRHANSTGAFADWGKTSKKTLSDVWSKCQQ
uniref:Uncharacterized protein n=1 Tax=Cucumis melo TaxID=3656 RepID=A0A9I9DA75_CUCME